MPPDIFIAVDLDSTRLTRSTRSLDELLVSSIGLVKVRLVLRLLSLHRSVTSKYRLLASLIDKDKTELLSRRQVHDHGPQLVQEWL